MATFEQEKATRESLKAVLEQLRQIKPEDLVRKEVLGTDLNFESGVEYFKRTLELFKKLDNTPLDDVPYNALNKILNQANQAIQNFRNILDFSFKKYPQNAVGTRDQFIASIRDTYDQYYDIITPILALSYQQGANLEQFEKRAISIVTEMQEMATNLKNDKEKASKDIKETLEKVRTAAQEAGVSQHSIHFKNEAERHRKAATSWLLVTVVAAVIVIICAISNYNDVKNGKALLTADSIQLGLAKLIIFSVLSYFVVWSGKLYRANLHNFVVNRHRQNALSSFETFVKATTDEGTKNAVLIQATQSIFMPQHTGYIGYEADAPASPQILEIIRDGMSKK